MFDTSAIGYVRVKLFFLLNCLQIFLSRLKITNTADALRTLAHSTIGGRFHWFRETGIIESDDIIRIQKEIEATVDFSNMVCLDLISICHDFFSLRTL